MTSSSKIPFQTFATPPNTILPLPSGTTFNLNPTPHHPTDIWRKPGPPIISTFNAPLVYKSVPLSSFRRLRVTVSAAWDSLYDQGGLVLVLPGEGEHEEEKGKAGKWIKTGIEFFDGEEYVSTVAADRWADWSLVQTGIQTVSSTPGSVKKVTIEMERNAVEGTLWIYVIVPKGNGEKKVPVREVTWVLSENGEKECWVGVYAATPTVKGRGKEGLKVKFEGWELEVEESK